MDYDYVQRHNLEGLYMWSFNCIILSQTLKRFGVLRKPFNTNGFLNVCNLLEHVSQFYAVAAQLR